MQFETKTFIALTCNFLGQTWINAHRHTKYNIESICN
jgi:hypothetical protein